MPLVVPPSSLHWYIDSIQANRQGLVLFSLVDIILHLQRILFHVSQFLSQVVFSPKQLSCLLVWEFWVIFSQPLYLLSKHICVITMMNKIFFFSNSVIFTCVSRKCLFECIENLQRCELTRRCSHLDVNINFIIDLCSVPWSVHWRFS